MKVKVEITEELLAEGHWYGSVTGCTIWHALKAAGLPVMSVGGDTWTDSEYRPHPLPIVATTSWSQGGLRVPISSTNPTGFAGPFSFEVEL